MVVSSMTAKEMYDDLAADKGKIEIKRQQLEPKVINKFKKTFKFPAWELFEYKIPRSGNSYILYFYAENRRVAEKPVFDAFAIVFDGNKRLVLKWWLQPYKHKPSYPLIATRVTNIYVSHFFQRYKERVLKDTELSTNEVICRYFTRNSSPPLQMKLNEDIMKNYREYGETGEYGMKVRDGICLGRTSAQGYFDENSQEEVIDGIGNVYVTFINEGTLTNTQKEAVLEENIRYSKELFKILIADLKE